MLPLMAAIAQKLPNCPKCLPNKCLKECLITQKFIYTFESRVKCSIIGILVQTKQERNKLSLKVSSWIQRWKFQVFNRTQVYRMNECPVFRLNDLINKTKITQKLKGFNNKCRKVQSIKSNINHKMYLLRTIKAHTRQLYQLYL